MGPRWQTVLKGSAAKGKGPAAAACPPAGVPDGCQGYDEVEIRIEDTCVCLRRRITAGPLHEVSAYVPRAEIRHRRFVEGKLVSEDEIILNSLTVVHAPRHPPAGPPPQIGSPAADAPSPAPPRPPRPPGLPPFDPPPKKE